MSKASKITLCVGAASAFGFFCYVSGKQWLDKKKMNEVTLNDIQRQEKKKIENIYWLEKQLEMNAILTKHRQQDEEITSKLLGKSEKEI